MAGPRTTRMPGIVQSPEDGRLRAIGAVFTSIQEMYPHLYPQLHPDAGTLMQTLLHEVRVSYRGKKKKAGSSWKLTALIGARGRNRTGTDFSGGF